jgi:hypothetical protein
MKYMKQFPALLLSGSLIFFFSAVSCGSGSKDTDAEKDSLQATLMAKPDAGPQAPLVGKNVSFETKTFEVKDSSSKKMLGWGYDIFIDGKRTIHQPIIPAVPGNNSFSSEEKAKKTAEFAVGKMKSSGSLPTLSIEELDSLGVTK